MVCGETEVAAANLRITINNLEKMMDGGTTGFQKQLKVSVKHECTILEPISLLYTQYCMATHCVCNYVSDSR